ncbi:HTH-type transcriptional activator RhaS [Vibrio marisflavi CECT 7928]|uniref:HTH-type transcriptional activator RhaS n=1 Tax=Vibrio marisflavi CECT 7928 TaxID=634439 RepID=A0ABN8E389_9VIBR|nr:HTH-type transcriptional activator RhaS [Vibrio marisflavi CECT 7928]
MNTGENNLQLDKYKIADSVEHDIRPAQLVTLPSYMDCHDHDYTQVVIGLNGQAEFEVQGSGNKIGPGQGCVVSHGLDHAFGSLSQYSDILVVNLAKPSENEPENLKKFNDISSSDVYFSLDLRVSRLICSLVEELRISPDDLYLSRACCDTVIALLLRHSKTKPIPARESRFDMDAIDSYIERHLSQKITVTQLAGSVYLGESQFFYLFKEKFGVTPHQYVLSKRMEKAKYLIENSGLSLGQISELTGFSGQSTFSHSFAKLIGLSPSQYRKTRNK